MYSFILNTIKNYYCNENFELSLDQKKLLKQFISNSKFSSLLIGEDASSNTLIFILNSEKVKNNIKNVIVFIKFKDQNLNQDLILDESQTVIHLKQVIAQCTGAHSSVMNALSTLKKYSKIDSVMLDILPQREELLGKIHLWAQDLINEESSEVSNNLLDEISNFKAREAKLKAVLRICDSLFKDLGQYSKIRANLDQIGKELNAISTEYFNKWCQTWGDIEFDSSKPCIQIEIKSQIPKVTFDYRLITLSHESRTLKSLGFVIPEEIEKSEANLKDYGQIAKELKEITNFYCTIGDQILLSQRPMLIDAAKAFTALLESKNEICWNKESVKLRSWLDELKDFAKRFSAENKSLRRLHKLVLKLVCQLFDIPPAKWTNILDEVRTIIHETDTKYSNTFPWKKHWDHQLYKILEYYFNEAIIKCNQWLGFNTSAFRADHLSTKGLQINLCFISGQVCFRPSLEDIKLKIYNRIKKFLSTPILFYGLMPKPITEKISLTTSIFNAMYIRNFNNFPFLYSEAAKIMTELKLIKNHFKEWTSIYLVVQKYAHKPSSLNKVLDLSTLEKYKNNLILVKSKSQEFNKRFVDNELSCSTANIQINLLPIKIFVDWLYTEVDKLLISCLRQESEEILQQFRSTLDQSLAQLTSTPRTISEFIEWEKRLKNEVVVNQKLIINKHADLDKRNSFLQKWNAKNALNLTEIYFKYDEFQRLFENRNSILDSFRVLIKSKMETNLHNFETDVNDLISQWNHSSNQNKENELFISEIGKQCEKLENDLKDLLDGCKLFDLPEPKKAITFREVFKEISETNQKLTMINEFERGLAAYQEMEWLVARNKLNTIENYIVSWEDNLETGNFIKQKVQEWKKLIPVLKLCRGDGFAKKHWNELINILEIDPAVTFDTLKFSNLIEKSSNIISNKEKIKEINSKAIGETSIRDTFNELNTFATRASFDLFFYSTESGEQIKLIKNWRNVLNQISESILTLNSLKGSEYFSNDYADQGNQWETKLISLESIVNVLNVVQRKWTYLEPIHSRNKSPNFFNDNDFSYYSKDFISICKAISADPHVMRLLRIPDLKNKLADIDSHLDLCQKKLNLFIEQSRNRLPRFYFLADDDLLLVLAGKVSINEAGLLRKLFNNTVDKLHFNGSLIVKVESPEGEVISLKKPVETGYSYGAIEVENWLKQLEIELRETLKSEFFDVFENSKLDSDFWSLTSQILSIFQWVQFTAQVESSIKKNSLKNVQNDLSLQLSQLTDSKQKVQNSLLQIKIKSMIFDVIHFLTVVEELIAGNVDDVNDWKWIKQLRYYANKEKKKITICMGIASTEYSFEYIGCYGSSKLVHTPLTDKCFLVCLQALSMGLGGNPYGPAGTGKTETVKALGKHLGRQVLVFNCDEAIDTKAMTRILIGLIKCGSWGCFDEFNRLQVDVLSSLSSQIQAIQNALRNSSSKVMFPGIGEIDLNLNSGIFVTLNPAGNEYKGRNKLPDNLNALFLPVAMTVPDSAIISLVLLLSEGLSIDRSKILGEKITAWFHLAKDCMSYQKHYDWGLRAIKSCLSYCGQSLKNNNQGSDLNLVIRALQKHIKPKLFEQDIFHFDNLVQDVFGDQAITNEDCENNFSTQIELIQKIFIENNLVPDKTQIEKVLELNDQLNARLGVAILGETGTGKSTIWKILSKYKKLKDGININSVTINPKAMSRNQLLGFIDEETREWRDGVFTSWSRQISRDESDLFFWIIFDGDIDPPWVESLNSVLDDNKVLTLPSGERIDFNIKKVNIIFETTSLHFASPATISRLGIISISTVKSLQLLQSKLGHIKASSTAISEEVDALIRLSNETNLISKTRTAICLINYFQSKEKNIEKALSFFNSNDFGPVIEPYFIGNLVVTQSIYKSVEFISALNDLNQHLLVVGKRGIGKHIILSETVLKSGLVVTINSNPETISDDLINKLKKVCLIVDTGLSQILKAPNGGKLIIYVRNLEFLKPDSWGSVQLLAFLTSLMTYSNFYDDASSKLTFIENFQIVATSSQYHSINERFFSLINVINILESSLENVETVIKMLCPTNCNWSDVFSSGFIHVCNDIEKFTTNLTIVKSARDCISFLNRYPTVTSEVMWIESFRVLQNCINEEHTDSLVSSLGLVFGYFDHKNLISQASCLNTKIELTTLEKFENIAQKALKTWITENEAILPSIGLISETLKLFAEVSIFFSNPDLSPKTLILLGPSGSGRKLASLVMAQQFGFNWIWQPKEGLTEKHMTQEIQSLTEDDSEKKLLLLVDQVNLELISFLRYKLVQLILESSSKTIIRVIIIMNNLSDENRSILSRFCHIYRVEKWSLKSIKMLPKLIVQNISENDLNSFIKILETHSFVQKDHLRVLSILSTFNLLLNEKMKKIEDRKEHLSKGVAKLEEASNDVEKLKHEAQEQQKKLATKRSEADVALNLITSSMNSSEEQKVELEEIKSKTEKESHKLKLRKSEIEAELKEIQPVLEAAKAAVGSIKSESLAEIRSLRAPPEVIRDILEGVLRLMGVNDTSWVSMKSFLSRRGIREEIMNFDSRKITPEIRSKVENLFNTKAESFDERQAKRASVAAVPLANWVIANLAFSKVLHKIKPLEDEQNRLEARLKSAKNTMSTLTSELKGVETEVGSLKKRLNQVTLEAAEIELNLKQTTQILTQSEVLITELGDEFKRWKQQLNEIYEMITVLSRKCLTVAAYAHLANLEQSNEKRKKIFENLINLLELNTFDLTEFLELDSEEDVFINISSNFLTSLLIDPSRKSLEKFKNAEIIDINKSDWRRSLELSLRFGKTVIIDGLIRLNLTILPIIKKEIFGVEGSRQWFFIGDKKVDFNSKCKLIFLTTEKSNQLIKSPLINPINLVPNESQMTQTLLSLIIKIRRPELEEQKLHLEKEQKVLKENFKNLESQLLQKLHSSKGNILNNQELIKSLKEIKTSSKDIQVSLNKSLAIGHDLNRERVQYQDLASFASTLLTVLQELTNLNNMYRFGLKEFQCWFKTCLQNNQNLNQNKLLQIIYQYVSRFLNPEDKIVLKRFLQKKFSSNLTLNEPNLNLSDFLREFFSSKENRICLIVTASGSDPTAEIKDILRHDNRDVIYFSMGSEVIQEAESVIQSGLKSVICINNLHLVISWLPRLAKLLSELTHSLSSQTFFILVSQSSKQFPACLLEISTSYMYISSPGLRAQINSFSKDVHCPEIIQLNYFHSICCERKNFIPLGWTKLYNFGFNDYHLSLLIIGKVNEIRNNEHKLEYFRGLLGNVIYGGKLDNQVDQNILTALMKIWFSSKHFSIDQSSDDNEFKILGLSSNVNKWKMVKFEEKIEKGLKKFEKFTNPIEKEKDLHRLKQIWNSKAKFKDEKLGILKFGHESSPLKIFIESEYQNIIQLVKTIDRDVSHTNLDIFNCLINNQTPDLWLRQWPTGPVEADKFITNVIKIEEELKRIRLEYDEKNLFNISCFLHPSAFINALRQKASRDLKKSIDLINVYCEWGQPEISTKISSTATITGFILEAAILKNGLLQDCPPDSDLQSFMPSLTLHYFDKKTLPPYSSQTVSLPVFGSSSRDSLITWFDVPCKSDSQNYWIQVSPAIIINYP